MSAVGGWWYQPVMPLAATTVSLVSAMLIHSPESGRQFAGLGIIVHDGLRVGRVEARRS